MDEFSEVASVVIGAIIIAVGVVVVLAIVMAFPVMWLWNWLMPDLFDISTVTFWQALGISLLCGILFKSSSSSSSNK